MSVECDPRRVTRQHLQTLRGLGFRHVAFGVADLDETVQAAIGRRSSPALIDDVWAAACEAGFERIQLALLIGYTATPATPLLGLGAGAVGEIDGSMFWNHAALPAWHAALRARQLPVARARMAGAEAKRLCNCAAQAAHTQADAGQLRRANALA